MSLLVGALVAAVAVSPVWFVAGPVLCVGVRCSVVKYVQVKNSNRIDRFEQLLSSRTSRDDFSTDVVVGAFFELASSTGTVSCARRLVGEFFAYGPAYLLCLAASEHDVVRDETLARWGFTAVSFREAVLATQSCPLRADMYLSLLREFRGGTTFDELSNVHLKVAVFHHLKVAVGVFDELDAVVGAVDVFSTLLTDAGREPTARSVSAMKDAALAVTV